MASTYVPLQTYTLGSSQLNVTFNSFSGYTDLELVIVPQGTSSGADVVMQFNSDSGTNYSRTYLLGNGSTAVSGHTNPDDSFRMGGDYANMFFRVHIFNYSNSNTYKTVISNTNGVGNYAAAVVGLWRNSSAITSITLGINGSNSFGAGSTFSLYGIKAA